MNELQLKQILIHIIKTSHNFSACDFCKHCKPCLSKQCVDYIEGIGDAEGKYPNFRWTCEDFVFGTCPTLENTPCNGCIQNDFKSFEFDDYKLEMYAKTNNLI